MTNPRPPAAPGRTSLPRWARAADALTLAVAAFGVAIAGFGALRLHVAGVRLSFASAPRIFGIALAIFAIRHLVVRRDPLVRRAWDGAVGLWRADDLRAVGPVWLATRFGVLLIGLTAITTFGYQDTKLPFRLFESELLNLPARYDAGWYLGIATEGYSYDPEAKGQQNIAFMPALPMLMRVAGRVAGGQTLWAGQVLVLAASLWGFLYVYRLARSALGDEDRAGTAVALLAAYPFALFYSAVYTESIFLLASAGAFYHLARREYVRVAAFALLAGFARPNGFLLAVPLVLAALWPALSEAWRDRSQGLAAPIARVLRNGMLPIAASAAAVVGVLAFSAYIDSLTGRPLAWLEAHAAWGRTFGTWLSQGPFQTIQAHGIYDYARWLPVDALNGVAILGFLLAIWPVTRRLGVAYGAFLIVNLIPPLTSGGLLSIGRVTSCMFPVFIWLAAVIPDRHRAAWVAIFAMLQAWGAALFFTWREFI